MSIRTLSGQGSISAAAVPLEEYNVNDSSVAVATNARQFPAGGKYLTFALGAEEYGLAILKVREIIGLMEITALPRSAEYIKGVVNLRGQVISVVDLRAKFRMSEVARTDQTCIIFVEIARGERKVKTGIIVDRVSEVLDIAVENIEPPPALGEDQDARFILGMAKAGDRVKILLDIDQVLAADTGRSTF